MTDTFRDDELKVVAAITGTYYDAARDAWSIKVNVRGIDRIVATARSGDVLEDIRSFRSAIDRIKQSPASHERTGDAFLRE